LRRNPLGDPHVRDLFVYLPPSYDGRRRFPVAFALASYPNRGASLLNVRPFSPGLLEQLERQRTRELIVVLPDCFTAYGGSQYLNSSATGRYEDYVSRELVGFVDAAFRTVPRAEARAVLGHSSGGYGALVLAMRHPDVFGLAACHSGDMGFDTCYRLDFPKYASALPRYGGSTRTFLRRFAASASKSGEMMTMLGVVAMAACYSPNPRSRLGFELPFDERTGEIRPAVWRRWLAWDPVHMASRHRSGLRRLRLLFLDCGTRDEYYLHLGARIFTARLRRLGVRHVYEEFDGGHRDGDHRYARSLALIGSRIAAT